ncbi:MAG: ABC transporter substrate-binding protein, partial [Xenococcaceae cyanobacterium]
MSQKLKRNRTKSSLTWAIALFTTITSLLSACGGSGESGTSSGGGLKLGGLFPITGDLSAVGQNLPVAAKLAVD